MRKAVKIPVLIMLMSCVCLYGCGSSGDSAIIMETAATMENPEPVEETVEGETELSEAETTETETITASTETAAEESTELTEIIETEEPKPSEDASTSDIGAPLKDGVYLSDCVWPVGWTGGGVRDISFFGDTMTIYASFYQYNKTDWSVEATYPAEERTFKLAPDFGVYGAGGDSPDRFHYTIEECVSIISSHNGLGLNLTIENGMAKEIVFVS